MRRSAPVVVVAVGLCALLASYVWYSQNVVNSLQSEAAQTSAIYARVLRANTDTTREAANLAMLDLIDAIKKLRVPVVLTSVDGKFVTSVNIPDGADPLAYAATLDKQNSPFVQEGVGKVHFGNTPLINGMRVIPLLQVGVLIILIFAGVSVLLTRGRADRESVFAGMARESAHQLGTPLSSLHGWMELLREREDPMITQALPHMESDIERLERVAHRFERIGRHPKRDPIDVGAIATHVVTYFQARVPTLANAIALSTVVPEQRSGRKDHGHRRTGVGQRRAHSCRRQRPRRPESVAPQNLRRRLLDQRARLGDRARAHATDCRREPRRPPLARERRERCRV
jgi:signal transduction histidine kinase